TMRAAAPDVRLGWSVPKLRRDPFRSRVTRLPALIALQVFRALLPARAAAAVRARRCDALMVHWRLITPRLVSRVLGAGGEVRALAAGPAEAEDVSDADEGEVALRRTAVQRALTSLPAREREIIALKFHAGLSNAELARVLGVSESNAGTLLYRTMEKLRKACDATP